MKAVWIVRWRGFDETCTNPQEAMDRRDQLEARGIEVETYEMVAGWRREIRWPPPGGQVPPLPRPEASAAAVWRP
jgi:hypothetical protein